MENATSGRVFVPARIENLEDLFDVRRGRIPDSGVRRLEVTDALIDPGVSGLLVPMRFVEQLGLSPCPMDSGERRLATYRAVRLTIQGRDFITDVAGIADDLPVIVGSIPLLAMDWVVDVKGRKLIGNPEHGGEDMVDIL